MLASVLIYCSAVSVVLFVYWFPFSCLLLLRSRAERSKNRTGQWVFTSYNELRREALAVERWNRLHPDQPPRTPHIVDTLRDAEGPIIAATDYMKAVADQIAPWLAGRLEALGTDGYGRSDNRQFLRKHFEINGESIAAAALARLTRDGQFDVKTAASAFAGLNIDTERIDPARP
jgi:pyruvate dehydrogenase E1 component